jgi:uncharacterized membrane protein YqaE (UPF0057 family)
MNASAFAHTSRMWSSFFVPHLCSFSLLGFGFSAFFCQFLITFCGFRLRSCNLRF